MKRKNAILYYYKLVEQPCELSAFVEFSDSLTKVSFDDIHEGDRLPAVGHCNGLRFPDKMEYLDGFDIFGQIYLYNEKLKKLYGRVELRKSDFAAGLPLGCGFNLTANAREDGIVDLIVKVPELKVDIRFKNVIRYDSTLENCDGVKINHYEIYKQYEFGYPIVMIESVKFPKRQINLNSNDIDRRV